MKYFRVRWRYASQLELARSNFIKAQDRDEAIRIIRRSHIDPYSELRKEIEILDVTGPIRAPGKPDQQPA